MYDAWFSWLQSWFDECKKNKLLERCFYSGLGLSVVSIVYCKRENGTKAAMDIIYSQVQAGGCSKWHKSCWNVLQFAWYFAGEDVFLVNEEPN